MSMRLDENVIERVGEVLDSVKECSEARSKFVEAVDAMQGAVNGFVLQPELGYLFSLTGVKISTILEYRILDPNRPWQLPGDSDDDFATWQQNGGHQLRTKYIRNRTGDTVTLLGHEISFERTGPHDSVLDARNRWSLTPELGLFTNLKRPLQRSGPYIATRFKTIMEPEDLARVEQVPSFE